MKPPFNKINITIAITTLIVGIGIGYIIKPSSDVSSEHLHNTELQESVWTCSMHPQIRQSEPGQCPICGMDLIPLDQEEMDENPLEIKMSATAVKLANIQTAKISRKKAIKEVSMTGKVQLDERNIFTQTSHMTGRIERLMINYTGDFVRKGQILAYIYAPELVTAQEELFQAYKSREANPSLYQAARNKLLNWKLTEQQIDKILESNTPTENFPILSDLTGVILKKNVNLGDHVKQGASLFEVADLNSVWVLFDIYESEIPWVKIGDKVEFYVQSLPGQFFEGKISFIDPVINPNTRVAKARVIISNPKGKLKPEMFVEGTVKSAIQEKVDQIVIPKSAVMWTGKRSIVYVKSNSSTGVSFMMREVRLGPALGDSYVIEKGLVDGDEVAVNGTFSIDAAAQLAGKKSMMNPMQEEGQSIEFVDIGNSAKAALFPLFETYNNLKNALVSDEFDNAIKTSKQLNKELDEVSMGMFKDKSHHIWMQQSEIIKKESMALSKSTEIGQARKSFQPISDAFIILAKSFAPVDNTLYVQFCPMADDNRGAHWLSTEEEVLNPYFGASMLRCGNIESEIK